jgi:hypothetical protein
MDEDHCPDRGDSGKDLLAGNNLELQAQLGNGSKMVPGGILEIFPDPAHAVVVLPLHGMFDGILVDTGSERYAAWPTISGTTHFWVLRRHRLIFIGG